MVAPDLADLARRVADLPPLPAALTEVISALENGQLSTQRCIDLIERDPALAGRMLRLANSAFYGRPGRVGSISAAVALLGLRTVASVLAAASLKGSLQIQGGEGFSLERYWRHAISSGLICSQLAPRSALDPSEAFLAGLMHDIGQLIMAALMPEEMAEVLRLRQDGSEDLNAELDVIGLSHPQLGEQVARHWNLPGTIVQAIAQHHEPLSGGHSPASLAQLLQLGDSIVLALDRDNSPAGAVQVPDALWQALRVPPEEREPLYARIALGVQDFCSHL